MANIKSAKKRIRVNERQHKENRLISGRTRAAEKFAREQIAAGDLEAATEAVRAAVSEFDRAAQKGVIHKNKAARFKSRLMKELATLES